MIQGHTRAPFVAAAWLTWSLFNAAPASAQTYGLAPMAVTTGQAQETATAAHPHQAALDHLAQKVEKGAYRGVVALLEVNGEVVMDAAIGSRDAQGETPMTNDTIFRIYSMTKAVTAVAVLMLVEDGKVDLDAPASKYLPELEGLTVARRKRGSRADEIDVVPCESEMTVRDLMRHSSGFTYGFMGSSTVDRMVQRAGILRPSNTNADMLRKLAELPLKHQPGTRFEYGVSSDVLGRLVEVVSGETLDTFFETRICGPLGMKDTGFTVPKAKRDRVATCFRRSGGKLAQVRRGGALDPKRPGALLSGGGGLYSTAPDYLAFCRMLLRGGTLPPGTEEEPGEEPEEEAQIKGPQQGNAEAPRLLSQDSVDAMLSDQLKDIPAPMLMATGGGFGFGLSVNTTTRRKGPNTGTAGWGGLAGTGFWIDRKAGAIGIFMIQNMNEVVHNNAFQAAAYKGLGR